MAASLRCAVFLKAIRKSPHLPAQQRERQKALGQKEVVVAASLEALVEAKLRFGAQVGEPKIAAESARAPPGQPDDVTPPRSIWSGTRGIAAV